MPSDDRYERLVEAAKAKAIEKFGSPVEDHINFVMNAGDQVDTAFLDQYENLHFKQSRALMSNVPFMTVIGNHEYSGDSDLSNYFGHFIYDDISYQNISGSNGEHYYAFQIANALFVMMNSNENWQSQTDWVESVVNQAKTDNNIEWVFGTAHHPILAEQLPGDASSYMRDTTPIDYEDVQKTMEYHVYQIVNIDLDNREMTVETYSTGNKDINLDNVLVDSYYTKLTANAPSKPSMANVPSQVTLPHSFNDSVYQGDEAYNSTEFQVTGSSGDFLLLKIAVKRDFENLYLSTGAPNYTPIDQNDGVDIFSLELNEQDLTAGTHYIRVRYRDQSLHWSEWSDAAAFTSYPGSAWFQMGSYQDDNDDFRHDGRLKDVRIWERALGINEIAALAQAAPAPTTSSGLLLQGTGNYASVADTSIFPFGADQDFTIELRVKTDGFTKAPSFISNKNWQTGKNADFILSTGWNDNSFWKVN